MSVRLALGAMYVAGVVMGAVLGVSLLSLWLVA